MTLHTLSHCEDQARYEDHGPESISDHRQVGTAVSLSLGNFVNDDSRARRWVGQVDRRVLATI